MLPKRGAVPVDESREADRTLQGKMSAVWHGTNLPTARLSECHRCRQVLYRTTALHAFWEKQTSVQKNCESLREQTKVLNTEIDQKDVSFCSKIAKIEGEQIGPHKAIICLLTMRLLIFQRKSKAIYRVSNLSRISPRVLEPRWGQYFFHASTILARVRCVKMVSVAKYRSSNLQNSDTTGFATCVVSSAVQLKKCLTFAVLLLNPLGTWGWFGADLGLILPALSYQFKTQYGPLF